MSDSKPIEVHTDRTDEGQVMHLAAWLRDHGTGAEALPGESDAGRAVRALDVLLAIQGTVGTYLDAPRGATVDDMVAHLIRENIEVRKALTEVLNALVSGPQDGMTKTAVLTRQDYDRWRNALVRPWSLADHPLARLMSAMGITLERDPATGGVTVDFGSASPCGEPDCPNCSDEAAAGVTGTPLAEGAVPAQRADTEGALSRLGVEFGAL